MTVFVALMDFIFLDKVLFFDFVKVICSSFYFLKNLVSVIHFVFKPFKHIEQIEPYVFWHR
ncbi:hypothetical protein AS889_18060 [Pseudomonas putida]|nr:hypothetical protein AS889_18060 [Pseudomonas putida]